MENSFAIEDPSKKRYFLRFEHHFWEIIFQDKTHEVYIREGALTKNGEELDGSIQKYEIKHANLLSAMLDVQTRVNMKIKCGYTFADSDAISNFECIPTDSTSENQVNQKRSASSQDFDLPSAKESLVKKLCVSETCPASGASAESNCQAKGEKFEKNHTIRKKIQFDDSEDSEEPPETEEQPAVNFNPEEPKGAYLVKTEFGEILFYKIRISENQLLIEEGVLNDDHPKQPKSEIYHDYNEAKERMKLLIKEKEKEGYKNTRKGFVYDFQPQAASSINAQRTTLVLPQNAPENENPQRENPVLQHNTRKEESLPPVPNRRRSLRRKTGRNLAEGQSPQTRSHFSFKPIEWPEPGDPTGLILREKLNGVTCVWNGKDRLTSLKGHGYKVPNEFSEKFPPVSLLGVVYLGPDSSCNVEMSMRSQHFEVWKKMKFVAYDILDTELPFKERMETIEELLKGINSPYIEFCKYTECKGKEHFKNEQEVIKEKKGDGILLNNSSGRSFSGVNAGLYVWKNYTVEEAELIGYICDGNRYLKSFQVRHHKGDNNAFRIHKGIETLTKEKIPKIGDIILYKTAGWRSKNVPKLPILVGIKPSEEPK